MIYPTIMFIYYSDVSENSQRIKDLDLPDDILLTMKIICNYGFNYIEFDASLKKIKAVYSKATNEKLYINYNSKPLDFYRKDGSKMFSKQSVIEGGDENSNNIIRWDPKYHKHFNWDQFISPEYDMLQLYIFHKYGYIQ